MIALTIAETQRLVYRRMTKFFPLTLALLMVVGIVIAILVVNNNSDGGVDFIDDLFVADTDAVGRTSGTSILGPMGFLIPIMAFVVGASYFGADEKAGMIEHLLTWEPRRGRLLLARLGGGAATMFVISALLSAFLVGLLYLLTVLTDGDTSGIDGDVLQTIIGAIARSGAAGALFFILGVGLTVLTNSSVASIVGFLIYVFVIEVALIGPLLPKISAWLPVSNSDPFVSGREYEVIPGPFDDGQPYIHHGYLSAGLLILVWASVFAAIAYVWFSRRDID